MAKHERWENKEEESLEADTYLEEVLKVFGDPTSLFDDLQNSKETRELDQFVHSSNPRDSCNLIPTFKDLVKWQNGQEIYKEPAFEILNGYQLSVLY
jgi:hypothetical protein